MTEEKILEEQKKQLDNLIQRYAEELDEALDKQESSVCEIGSDEYEALQKKICNLTDKLEKVSRLRDDRFGEKEPAPKKHWYEDSNTVGSKLLLTGVGAVGIYLGELAMTSFRIKQQNAGNFDNPKLSTNNWMAKLKNLF